MTDTSNGRITIGVFGDAGVGKTTLISQLDGEDVQFAPEPTIEDETHHSIGDTSFLVLDTSGNIAYKDNWPDQMRRCTAILVIANGEASVVIAREILSVSPACPAILVYYNRDQETEQVTKDVFREMATQHKHEFVVLSRVEGRVGAENLFQLAIDLVLKQRERSRLGKEHREPLQLAPEQRSAHRTWCSFVRMLRLLRCHAPKEEN